MKRSILLSILIWAHCSLFSKSILNIKYDNSEILYLVESNAIQSGIAYTHAIDSAFADENGYFKFSFKANSGFYEVRNKLGYPIYYSMYFHIEDGDTLEVKGEGYQLEFSGNSIAKHQFQLELYQLDYLLGNYSERNRFEISRFDTFVNNLRQKRLATIEKNVGNYDSTYISFLKAKTNLSWCYNIISYCYLRNSNSEDWTMLPWDTFSFSFDPLSLLDGKFCFISEYGNSINFINRYYYSKTKDEIGDKKYNHDSSMFYTDAFIESTFSGVNEEIASMMFSESIKMRMSDVDVFYSFIDYWESKWNENTSKYILRLKENIEKLNALRPGKMAPNITLPNQIGEEVQLSDFKGNVIYLSFWGTWCGPCVKAIPDYIKLQDTLKGKNVVFFQVAMENGDASKARWKNYLEEKYPNWGGQHLIAEGQFYNDQVLKYNVVGAPTYVLIDQEGKIVLPLSPSPKNVLESILELL